MYSLRLLFLLGLAYYAQAECRKPTPMENFSQKNFSGLWYAAAYNLLNPTDEAIYSLSRCSIITFGDGENGRNRWEFNTLVAELTRITLGGTFYVPNPAVGYLKDNTVGLINTYESYVTCTDYTTYSVAYSCLEVVPGYTTEWIHLHLRDASKYDEVVVKPELDKCFAGLPVTSAKNLKIRPYTNCQGLLSGVLELIGNLLKGVTGVVAGLLKLLLP